MFAVTIHAPIPLMVVELFPPRIRYSAPSLPCHIGSGWFGGFLPGHRLQPGMKGRNLDDS